METATIAGRPAEPDLERAAAAHGSCLDVVRSRRAESAHDTAQGGFWVAFAGPYIQGKLSAKVQLPTQDDLRRQAFGERAGVIIRALSNHNLEAAPLRAATHGAPAQVVGVGGNALDVEGSLALTTMTERRANGLQRALSAPEATAAS